MKRILWFLLLSSLLFALFACGDAGGKKEPSEDEEIEEEEIAMGIENEDEYVLKCQGLLEMDPDELNDLIANRDPHALEFFGLEDADDDELDEWDANDLDELPLIKDFVEDFEPYSPYDEGWDLNVRFVDPNE